MAKINHVKNKVKLGDAILFSRKGIFVEGKVYEVGENSVLADISDEDRLKLDYVTPKTVVNHKNYMVVSTKPKKVIS
jgi:uncharacterized protein YkvS